jgi:hypothetical protein
VTHNEQSAIDQVVAAAAAAAGRLAGLGLRGYCLFARCPYILRPLGDTVTSTSGDPICVSGGVVHYSDLAGYL